MDRSRIATVVALALLVVAQRAGAQVCTYNNATTSFGASYTTNQESSVTPLACSANITAARVNDTTYGRWAITAPQTGDFKFLVKSSSQNTLAPTFVMFGSLNPESANFPDPNIQAPLGGGCNVPALERHLHRTWPLFGQTYYYGDFNANPPNDPTAVTNGNKTSYVQWQIYDPAADYLYKDPDNRPGGTFTHGWGPQPSGQGSRTNIADETKNAVAGGYPDGCARRWAVGTADYSACSSCMKNYGYYLRDGATPGDLMNSVFNGKILNDYPPAWVNMSWAYGYVLNYTLHDAAGNPLQKIQRDQTLSNNGDSCPSTPNADQAGNFGPGCGLAYPTWQWSTIQTITTYRGDQSDMNGGHITAWTFGPNRSTPAGDLLATANRLLDFTASCNYCQTKGVLYIGFGIPCSEAYPNLPSIFAGAGGPMPPQTIAPCTGECAYYDQSPACTTGPSGTPCTVPTGQLGNWLPHAAHYLYNEQNVLTYFIGLGPHTASMRRAAAEGHGKYFDGQDPEQIHAGLLAVLQDLISQASSSATSTVNTVQVNVAGQEELVPRFVAKQNAGLWEGHLLKYYLFSEFAANCGKAGDQVKVPNPQQPVCTATCVCPGGSCSATWLLDYQCKLISPDKTGFLFQSTWNGTTLVPGNFGAVPVWDVNDQLRTVNMWYQRKVYTAIDTNGDGVIDYNDGDGVSPLGMYLITAGSSPGLQDMTGGVSDAVADALAPYMALDGTPMCANIESALGIVLPPSGALRLRACARVILNFTLGEDLVNQNQLDPTSPNYRIVNRINMLGDIFHSSPTDIGPPVGKAQCGTNNRRCVPTIFNTKVGPPVPGLPDFQPLEIPANVIDPATGMSVANTTGVDSYQAYYQNETFGKKRPRVTLFGANDGMVHAVQTACFVDTSSFFDPSLKQTLITPNYWDGPGSTPVGGKSCPAGTVANGSELWAFIPPDLLPKLGYVILGQHQFFVDSSPMVREIYAPVPGGTPSPTKRYTTTSASTMDFKRVAIFGEREGGTHWFGLDVTDPTAPQLRWMFPQPNTADELSVGFSWGDWVPNAPPIVPVRLAAPTGVTGYPTYLDSSGSNRPFQEQWVVLLPGGYDPYGVAGKTVFMLDAYTGKKIFQTVNGNGINQDFSFAALPAAIPWGTQVVSPASPTYNNGFFDTAVVGDVGGQVWTIRFNDVGQGYPAGLVNNWSFARAFRQFAADDLTALAGEYRMQHRTPIFQMAAAARMAEGTLRAFIGTGDRANIAENGVGQCSLSNPLACGKQNCVMTLATNAALNSSPSTSGVSSFKGDLAATYTSSTSSSFTSGGACSPGYTELNACVSCAGAGAGAGSTTAAPSEPQYACTNSSTGWQCAVRPIGATQGARLETATAAVTPDPNIDIGYYSRFLAFNLFDTNAVNPRSIFTASSGTGTYDQNALTETGLSNLFAASATKTFNPAVAPILTASTTGASPGFYFYYPVLDERTATNSVLLQNCVSWYSMEPGQPCSVNTDCASGTTCNTTTHTCTAPTGCGAASAVPARSAFLYQVNASDGSTDCGLSSSQYLRLGAPLNSFLVPPPPPQELVSVNKSGQLQYSIVAPAGQLSPPSSTSSGGQTPFSFFYTLETPRELHQCRHGTCSTRTADGTCTAWAAGAAPGTACY